MKDFSNIQVPNSFWVDAENASKFLGLPLIKEFKSVIICLEESSWKVYSGNGIFTISETLVKRYIRHLFKVARRHWSKKGCSHTATELIEETVTCRLAGCNFEMGQHNDCGPQIIDRCVVCGQSID